MQCPTIVDVVVAPGLGGSFFDDQAAVKAGAVSDGLTYRGNPITAGFERVRQPGEAVSVMLVLDDGYVALGDCASVQYAGYGGRDAPFRAVELMQVIAESVTPHLLGRSAGHFRPLAEAIDGIEIRGGRLHSAIRYGVTQALLDAEAWCKRMTMAEAVQEAYGIEGELRRVPIFCQSGSNWESVDSMIMKSVPVIPHGLITNVDEHVGRRGEKLKEYVAWISQRVREVRADPGYTPVIHIDVYGTIGRAFGENIGKITQYLDELAEAARPFDLRVEGPLDAGGRQAQIEKLCELRASLDKAGSSVGIVADEWCNTLDDIRAFADAKAATMIQVKTPDLGGIDKTVEALLYCQRAGVGAYSGGSANETDRSAQVTTHIAIACGASQCLAKPGLGVDEGLMVVNNEMSRVLALAGRPRGKRAS